MEVLPKCKTMEEREKKLQVQGIEIQYKYKGQTPEKQGISFKIGDNIFKGSKVDRQFSLGNFEKAITNHSQTWDPKQEITEHSTSQLAKQERESIKLFYSTEENSVGSQPTKGIKISLLKPEENFGQSSYGL